MKILIFIFGAPNKDMFFLITGVKFAFLKGIVNFFINYRPCVEAIPPPGRHLPKMLDRGCTFSIDVKITMRVLGKCYMGVWGA